MRKQVSKTVNLAVQEAVLKDTERLATLLKLNERAFDAQFATSDRLTAKAEKHFAAAAAILTLQLVDIKALTLTGSELHRGSVVMTLLGITASILAAAFALAGLRVRAHSLYPNMEQTTNELLNERTANTVTLRIATLYIAAADENQIINEGRGRVLAASGIFVVIALLLSSIGQLFTHFT